VLSSYTLEPASGIGVPTARGLIEGLAAHALELDRDYALLVSHANSLGDHEAALRRWLRDGVELLFSGGTPACAMLQRVLDETGERRPVVYFGAHPIDGAHEVALDDCLRDDTAGVRIELPLTYTPQNFTILRRLFPDLERVHIPFARSTAFCHRAMGERYDRVTAARGPRAWAKGDEVGFRSLRDLAWVIDADYDEYPLRSADDLEAALGAIPPRAIDEPMRDVVVAFNDTYHVAGSPHALLRWSHASNVPLVWVNNASMVPAGAVADFCNPFQRVAAHAATYVKEFLTGEWPRGRRTIEWSHDTHFSLHRARYLALGGAKDRLASASRRFHEIVG